MPKNVENAENAKNAGNCRKMSKIPINAGKFRKIPSMFGTSLKIRTLDSWFLFKIDFFIQL